MKNTWYKIESKTTDGKTVAEVSIMGVIGWDKTFMDFYNEFRALGDVDEIKLVIDSPGGHSTEGIAMYNYLRAHPARVNAYVYGLAGSAATLPLCAADHVTVMDGAAIMTHSAWTFACGNKDELQEQIDLLKKLDSTVLRIYMDKTGKSEEEMKQYMQGDNWIFAQEALSIGFADEIGEPLQAVACSRDAAFFLRSKLPPGWTVKKPEQKVSVTDEDTGKPVMSVPMPELKALMGQMKEAQGKIVTLETQLQDLRKEKEKAVVQAVASLGVPPDTLPTAGNQEDTGPVTQAEYESQYAAIADPKERSRFFNQYGKKFYGKKQG